MWIASILVGRRTVTTFVKAQSKTLATGILQSAYIPCRILKMERVY